MNIVGITACPTGIAHTYMAQEALEEAGRKRGHQIKLETQGAMGAENEITEDDLKQAEKKTQELTVRNGSSIAHKPERDSKLLITEMIP